MLEVLGGPESTLEYLHQVKSVSLDRWCMVEGRDSDYSVKDAVAQELQTLIRGRQAMMRWMCDSFKKERWKGESVAGDGLKWLVGGRKGGMAVVGSMNRCAKLI